MNLILGLITTERAARVLASRASAVGGVSRQLCTFVDSIRTRWRPAADDQHHGILAAEQKEFLEVQYTISQRAQKLYKVEYSEGRGRNS